MALKNITTLLLISVCTTTLAQTMDTRTCIFDGNFKSLQVKLSGNDYFPPVLIYATAWSIATPTGNRRHSSIPNI